MPSIPNAQLQTIEIVMSGVVSQTGVAAKTFDNVFYFRRTATTFAFDKPAAEGAFQASIGAIVIALLNAAYVQQYNQIRCIDDATDAPLKVSRTAIGGVTGDLQQNFDTLVMQYKTGYRGKSGRGSKHFAPLTATDTLGNTLVAGTIAAWNAIKPSLSGTFTDSIGNIWQPCIFSRKLSQIKTNPTVVVRNDVTALLLNKTTGTMRRRKVKTVTA